MITKLVLALGLGLAIPAVHGEVLFTFPVYKATTSLQRICPREYGYSDSVFHQEIFAKEVAILPLQDLMSFTSDVSEAGGRSGEDIFVWNLVPLNRGSVGWYVDSAYPLSSTGPHCSVEGTGIMWCYTMK